MRLSKTYNIWTLCECTSECQRRILVCAHVWVSASVCFCYSLLLFAPSTCFLRFWIFFRSCGPNKPNSSGGNTRTASSYAVEQNCNSLTLTLKRFHKKCAIYLPSSASLDLPSFSYWAATASNCFPEETKTVISTHPKANSLTFSESLADTVWTPKFQHISRIPAPTPALAWRRHTLLQHSRCLTMCRL